MSYSKVSNFAQLIGRTFWKLINEHIIERFKTGDKAAFELIFHEYYKALVIYVTTILRSRDEAEDIVQQVFVTVWEKGNNWKYIHRLRLFYTGRCTIQH